MSGKNFTAKLATSVLLLGFCIYIIQLFFSQNILLYIHPRYSVFAVTMSIIAAIILGLDIFLTTKNRRKRTEHQHTTKQGYIINSIVIIVLLCAFFLPPRELSSEATRRRSYQAPDFSLQANLPPTECPGYEIDSIDLWVFAMSQYPLHCLEGKDVEVSGFVFSPPDITLPSNTYYLGRVVMSCCAIDAQTYALPIQKSPTTSYTPDSWQTVRGSVQKIIVSEQEQLIVIPSSVTPIDKPNNPYEYL